MLERRGLVVSLSLGLLVGLTATALAWRETPKHREPAPLPTSIGRPKAAPPVDPEPLEESPTGLVLPAGMIRPDRARPDKSGKRLIQDLGQRGTLEYSLDPKVQAAAIETLEKADVPYGALVAIEPTTGRVLAYVSYSATQPGLVKVPVMANPPAASVFKLITGAALLEHGKVTPEEQVCYHGGHRGLTADNLIDDPLRDTKCESLAVAIGKSTNQVFGKLADRRLSSAVLDKYARAFRFGAALPFDLAVETSQAHLPPDPAPEADGKPKGDAADHVNAIDATRLERARTAAGFYNTHMSPLHAALVAAAIGNQGLMMTPHLVASHRMDDTLLYQATPVPIGRVIEPATASALADMMVTTTTIGTAGAYFRNRSSVLDGVDVAGKTGSLTAKGDDGSRLLFSWWVGFAPAKNPEIAIAALAVNNEQWRLKGALLARKALEAWWAEHHAPVPRHARARR